MPKVLILDVETKPALAYVWGLFDQNIGLNQMVSPSRIICFSAKWEGERDIFFHSDWIDGHVEMVKKAHEYISEADAVVGYNSDSFDLKKLFGEFLLCDLKAPPPVTSIDLLKSVKKLGLQSNKLAYVGPFLGIGNKIKNEGFELWRAVIDGDASAQRKMERYNVGDVRLTERLYKKIKPYIKNHPHLGKVKSGACGACGSTHIHSRGYRRTKYFRIQRLQCQSCGSWADGKREGVK